MHIVLQNIIQMEGHQSLPVMCDSLCTLLLHCKASTQLEQRLACILLYPKRLRDRKYEYMSIRGTSCALVIVRLACVLPILDPAAMPRNGGAAQDMWSPPTSYAKQTSCAKKASAQQRTPTLEFFVPKSLVGSVPQPGTHTLTQDSPHTARNLGPYTQRPVPSDIGKIQAPRRSPRSQPCITQECIAQKSAISMSLNPVPESRPHP